MWPEPSVPVAALQKFMFSLPPASDHKRNEGRLPYGVFA